MDIRNFFGAKGPGKGAPKLDPASSVKGSGTVEKKKKRGIKVKFCTKTVKQTW